MDGAQGSVAETRVACNLGVPLSVTGRLDVPGSWPDAAHLGNHWNRDQVPPGRVRPERGSGRTPDVLGGIEHGE